MLPILVACASVSTCALRSSLLTLFSFYVKCMSSALPGEHPITFFQDVRLASKGDLASNSQSLQVSYHLMNRVVSPLRAIKTNQEN